jgi:hypothetical protein
VGTLDRQLVAAMRTACLQNAAAIFRLHSLAETMYARAAANFGLVSTFGRHWGFNLRQKALSNDEFQNLQTISITDSRQRVNTTLALCDIVKL